MKIKNFHNNRLRALFLPDRCCFCGKPIPFRQELCRKCQVDAVRIESPVCINCGLAEKDCSCRKSSKFYQGITAPFVYTGVVREGISLWKFRKYYRSVDYFAKMIAETVNRNFCNESFDVITFIPQTKNEMKHREYNQGQLLAEKTGEILNIPVAPLLTKIYDTERQHKLLRIERSGNVFGVFDVCNTKMTENKRILLIDDIKTSGRTLNECAKMLHLYNAVSVHCAVIAITK